MEPEERLAAYLDGELDVDERTALEAELASDPALRARLELLQRADGVLASLSSPTPPHGYEERLRTHVDAVLADVLPAPAADVTAPIDLAAVRAGRSTPRWIPMTVGAAAGLLVLVGGGLVLTDGWFAGGDDADVGADAGMATMEADDAAVADGPMGPTVVLDGRSLTADEVDDLLEHPAMVMIADQRLSGPDAEAAGQRFQQLLGASVGPPSDGDAAGEDQEDGTGTATESMPRPDEPAEAIARCLDELLAADAGAIPTYAELATVDGAPVVLLGLVTRDPATSAHTRAEIWTLDRETCQVLRFAQD